MANWDQLFEEMSEVATGGGSVGATLINMNATNLDESALDARTYALVRIAAMVALDAPTISFATMLELGQENGMTPEEVAGVLVALSPIVGGPRVMSATEKLVTAAAAVGANT